MLGEYLLHIEQTMDPDKRGRLRKNHKTLKKDLDTIEVLDSLYSEGIFNDVHCEVVRSKGTPNDRNQELLTILKTTGNRGYDKFCEILKEHQPHLLTVLEETEMDQEITGESSEGNVFFEPSDDFELKGLIDQLTSHDRIGEEEFARMKTIVQSEHGCPADVIRTLDSPARFFGHLMDKKLVTRYNLAFLQSLLWRVGLKDMCEDVARFARVSDEKPIHFFLADSSYTENGYIPCKFHVQGNVNNFRGITIETICYIVSRYVGVPQTHVFPVGIQPSNSILLTVMVPEHSLHLLNDLEDCSWLAELGVDCITYGPTTINVKATSSVSAQPHTAADRTGELTTLESELDKKLREEQLLKQCLYDEQMVNENLRDMYDSKENEVTKCKEDLDGQMRGNTRLFCALMVTLNLVHMFLQRCMPHVGGSTWDIRERSAQTHFKYVVEKAKRLCRSDVLKEVIDAHSLVKEMSNARILNAVIESTNIAIQSLHANVRELLMYKMVGRSLGVETTPIPPPQQTVHLNVEVGAIVQLEPQLVEILIDLGKKLTKKQVEKLCLHYKLPTELKSDNKKQLIFAHLLVNEMNKTKSTMDEDVDRIIHESTRLCGGKDLWVEFQTRNKKRHRKLEEQQKNLSGVPKRLDNIEHLLKTLVAQNVTGSLPTGYPLPSFYDRLNFNKGQTYPSKETPYFQ
ncbi:uncharacterized protein LOC124137147 isoform X1 [Haliotis rufescens]|uniref:uncharacterized protein LOC124137147 isoform X1 n=2 Tax=Haliotis rufescens TaxID=6454 RepID=UPI00201F4E03|nr:uncharacterized protein LOC124137147 isoform X1 [Haliotis rufescens]